MDPWPPRNDLCDAPAIPGAGSYEWQVAEDAWRMSPELARIIGPDARGATIWRHIHPEDRPRMEARIAALVKAGSDFAHGYRIVTPTGDVRQLHDRGIIIRDRQALSDAAQT